MFRCIAVQSCHCFTCEPLGFLRVRAYHRSHCKCALCSQQSSKRFSVAFFLLMDLCNILWLCLARCQEYATYNMPNIFLWRECLLERSGTGYKASVGGDLRMVQSQGGMLSTFVPCFEVDHHSFGVPKTWGEVGFPSEVTLDQRCSKATCSALASQAETFRWNFRFHQVGGGHSCRHSQCPWHGDCIARYSGNFQWIWTPH